MNEQQVPKHNKGFSDHKGEIASCYLTSMGLLFVLRQRWHVRRILHLKRLAQRQPEQPVLPLGGPEPQRVTGSQIHRRVGRDPLPRHPCPVHCFGSPPMGQWRVNFRELTR